jgi:hypothetical protein
LDFEGRLGIGDVHAEFDVVATAHEVGIVQGTAAHGNV